MCHDSKGHLGGAIDSRLSRSASIADGWLGGAVDSLGRLGCCDSIGHLRYAIDSGRLFDVLWIADGVGPAKGLITSGVLLTA